MITLAVYWGLSVQNFIKIRSDLTFYCMMSRGLLFSKHSVVSMSFN